MFELTTDFDGPGRVSVLPDLWVSGLIAKWRSVFYNSPFGLTVVNINK